MANSLRMNSRVTLTKQTRLPTSDSSPMSAIVVTIVLAVAALSSVNSAVSTSAERNSISYPNTSSRRS